MANVAHAIKQAMRAEPAVADGRRARSAASRTKIIAAMVDLIAAGDPNPSAAAVAEKAGVGLRSVFRHFDEKDLILREIDELLVRAFEPLLSAPYTSEDWRDQLGELIERRAQVYEAIVVFRISALTVRYRSEFVRQNYLDLHAREKRMLDAVLPAAMQTSTRQGRAIMLSVSFDTWRLLRQDEQLSQPDTVAAIKALVDDILTPA